MIKDVSSLRHQRVAEVIRLLLPCNPDHIFGRDILAVVDHGLPTRAQFVSSFELYRFLAGIGLTRVERQHLVAWAVDEAVLEVIKDGLPQGRPEAVSAAPPVVLAPKRPIVPRTEIDLAYEFEPVGDPIFTNQGCES